MTVKETALKAEIVRNIVKFVKETGVTLPAINIQLNELNCKTVCYVSGYKLHHVVVSRVYDGKQVSSFKVKYASLKLDSMRHILKDLSEQAEKIYAERIDVITKYFKKHYPEFEIQITLKAS